MRSLFLSWPDTLMPFIPVAFLFAVLFVVLFFNVIGSDDESRRNQPFLVLILLCAFQSLLVGLRWGYGIQSVSYLLPGVAVAIPPLVYAGVLNLIKRPSGNLPRQILSYLAPALVVVVLTFVWRDLIDVAVILVFLGYAIGVLRLLRFGPDGFGFVPLDGAAPVYRAILFAAFALLLSATVDTLVFVDFLWGRGGSVSTVLSIANLGALIMLGLAATSATDSVVQPIASDLRPQEDDVDYEATMARVNELMSARKVYRDANLNLDRLARKVAIPARQISQAINRASGRNVSQYVNGYRIAEACDLLEATQKPVTEIMFDAGFQTKSNFNREFRRVTGMTPQDWRLKKTSKAGRG